MTSLLRDRKVDVHILYRAKHQGKRIWTQEECSAIGTEATLKQPRDDAYVMEVSERGESKIVLVIDFRKISSYTMRARCWHEVKYEGRVIALRFTDSETFHDFYTMLEQILKIYRKFKKPKNDESFLREVEMFQLQRLRPVDSVRRDRPFSLESTLQINPRPREMLPQGGKTRALNISKSLNPFEPKTPFRLADPVEEKKQVKKKPPPTPQKSKNSSEASGWPSVNRPLPPTPNRPLQTVPPTRASGDGQDAKQGTEFRPFSETGRTRVTFEEEDEEFEQDAEENSDENSSIYSAGTVYDGRHEEVFEPPASPPPRPTRGSRSSTDSSASDPTDPSRRGETRPPRKLKNSNIHEASGTPPVAQASYRPPSSNLPTPPVLPPPPAFQTPQRSDPIYGMATQWVCPRCTLRNDFWMLTCAACEWLRTDAWGCECPTVYSNDVACCDTCCVWRCQLCTFINTGEMNDRNVCQQCYQ